MIIKQSPRRYFMGEIRLESRSALPLWDVLTVQWRLSLLLLLLLLLFLLLHMYRSHTMLKSHQDDSSIPLCNGILLTLVTNCFRYDFPFPSSRYDFAVLALPLRATYTRHDMTNPFSCNTCECMNLRRLYSLAIYFPASWSWYSAW